MRKHDPSEGGRRYRERCWVRSFFGTVLDLVVESRGYSAHGRPCLGRCRILHKIPACDVCRRISTTRVRLIHGWMLLHFFRHLCRRSRAVFRSRREHTGYLATSLQHAFPRLRGWQVSTWDSAFAQGLRPVHVRACRPEVRKTRAHRIFESLKPAPAPAFRMRAE